MPHLARVRTIAVLSCALIAGTAPAGAQATVRINEIAWMGSASNANAEWIELANTGADAVPLADWRLTSSSGSPAITLSGSIAPGGYYLLERTGDDTVPDIAADYVYTGALANSGATLTLSDASGATIDQVAGGENWESIGGDNATKDTAQRTDTGWITAPATPRAANASGASGDEGGATATSTAGGGSSASLYVPSSSFSIDVGENRTVLLNVPAQFSAAVADAGSALPYVAWSFGDGGSAAGTLVSKIYRYPGTYVVVARVGEGVKQAEASIIVEVVPAYVRIAGVGPDGITIANDGMSRLDLSGWRLTTELGFFRIPQGMTLLPGAAVLFPWAVTGLPVAYAVTLAYPDGLAAARIAPADPAVLAVPAAPGPDLVQPGPLPNGSSLVQTVESALTNFRNYPAPLMEQAAPEAAAQLAASGAARAASAIPAVLPPEEASGGAWRASPWFLALLAAAAAIGGALMVL